MAARVVVTFLFAMVFATCGESRHDQPLKLGLLTYISEGSAQNAQDRQRAFHLAIAHLNQAGGVFGRPVESRDCRHCTEPGPGGGRSAAPH